MPFLYVREPNVAFVRHGKERLDRRVNDFLHGQHARLSGELCGPRAHRTLSCCLHHCPGDWRTIPLQKHRQECGRGVSTRVLSLRVDFAMDRHYNDSDMHCRCRQPSATGRTCSFKRLATTKSDSRSLGILSGTFSKFLLPSHLVGVPNPEHRALSCMPVRTPHRSGCARVSLALPSLGLKNSRCHFHLWRPKNVGTWLVSQDRRYNDTRSLLRRAVVGCT
jgi:hypothetical protein